MKDSSIFALQDPGFEQEWAQTEQRMQSRHSGLESTFSALTHLLAASAAQNKHDVSEPLSFVFSHPYSRESLVERVPSVLFAQCEAGNSYIHRLSGPSEERALIAKHLLEHNLLLTTRQLDRLAMHLKFGDFQAAELHELMCEAVDRGILELSPSFDAAASCHPAQRSVSTLALTHAHTKVGPHVVRRE